MWCTKTFTLPHPKKNLGIESVAFYKISAAVRNRLSNTCTYCLVCMYVHLYA